ncbi:MAG: tetratricopeptide repeat protein, partial [Desulfurellaceae bacterium]|nr:tetratricopeptide repeat protein [Desulfurellaceae bacterium]
NATAGTLVLVHKRTRRPTRLVGAAAGLLLALAYALPADLTFRQLLARGDQEVLYHREDGRGVVEVVEDASSGVRSLLANRLRREGADAPDDIFIARQQGYLPLLLHPAPHRLAVVGLGTGASLAASLLDRVATVTVIEISPGVIEAARLFARSSRAVLSAPKVRLVQADGGRFFRTDRQTYDVIVQDLFFPYRAGTGSLYTLEHYTRLRQRLAPKGLVVQWLSLNQLTPRAFQVIARTFQHVFPHTSLWLVGGYGALVGSESAHPIDFATLQQAYARALAQHPELSRTSPVDFLTAFVCGPDRLADWTAGAPFNTEDNGWIEYRSPLPFDQLYTENELAVASLSQLLDYRQPPPVTNLDPRARRRLERAYQARSLALAGLTLLHQGHTTAAHEHYRRAYRLNPKDAFAAHHMRDTWLASAADLVEQGRYREAQDMVFRVLSLSPGSLAGRFVLAQTLLAEDQPQRALAEFQTIAGRAPAYPGLQDALRSARQLSRRTDAGQEDRS